MKAAPKTNTDSSVQNSDNRPEYGDILETAKGSPA